jgi:hypothetical protein
MSHVPIGRRAMTAVLCSMVLMAAVFIPLVGIAVAATPPNNCESFADGETSFSTCWLDIAAPSSVRTDVAFTVQVRVTTNETREVVANTDPCGSKAAITLSLWAAGDGLVFVDDQTVNASAGIATFSLTIEDSGDYELVAEGPGGDLSAAATADCENTSYVLDEAPLMAVDIPADSPIAPCPPDTNCVQATSGSGTQATLIADEGTEWIPQFGADFFGAAIPTGNCTSGGPIDPNGVLGFQLDEGAEGTETKVIILALDMNLVDKGIGQFNVCWNQPTPFMTLTGSTAMTGDLPNCKGRDQVAPCVLSRTSGQNNVGFFSVLAPADDPADPFGYGH